MDSHAILFFSIIIIILVFLYVFDNKTLKQKQQKERMSVSNRGFYNYLPYDDSITSWDYYWEQPWWERVVGRKVGPVAPGVRGWCYSERY